MLDTVRHLPPLVPTARKQLRRFRKRGLERTRAEDLASKRILLRARPAHVSLEMTARCNLNCVICGRFHIQEEYSTGRGVYGAEAVTDVVGSSGYLDPATFERALDLLRDANTVELCGYGEPMMNPHFFEYAHQLKQHGHHVNTITNGTLLNAKNAQKLVDDRFDLISISIDGHEAETLEVGRGVDRDALFANLERLNELKRAKGLGPHDAPRISVSFAVARFNVRELPDLARALAARGVGSLFTQMLDAGTKPEMLGKYLVHTDEAVREEAVRSMAEAEAICREHGMKTDFARVPTEVEGWEPEGPSLDEALAVLTAEVAGRSLLKREYKSLGEIKAEREAAAAQWAAGEHPAPTPAASAATHAEQVVLPERVSAKNAHCLDFFRYAFVAWNGKVLSCCFERHAVGDLNVQRAEEIWNGPTYVDLRRAYHEQGIGSVCAGCSKILD